jgi:hypothetical protein
MTGFSCEVEIANTELAVDIVLIDQPAHPLNCFQTQVPQGFGGVESNPLLNTRLIDSLTGSHMTAIAA